MQSVYRMINTVQSYAWGHTRCIPDFLNIDWPEGRPAAELWMGSHPGAPSRIQLSEGAGLVDMDKWIASAPASILGEKTHKRFGALPFLLKLLAAGKALSIQAHPDEAAAREGFEREERLGIPPGAPGRSYKDSRHKPEIIMALTPFTAMIGFREPRHTGRIFTELCSRSRTQLIPREVLAGLVNGENEALKPFLESLLTSSGGPLREILHTAVEESAASSCSWDALSCQWVKRLNEQFPGDAGVLAPLFLNVVEISPGEALYQPARMLHAYLEGFGVELMANSDNVLRGGLTVKNVDVNGLLSVLDFCPSEPCVLRARRLNAQRSRFDTPAGEFFLDTLNVPAEGSAFIERESGPVIVLVLEKSLSIQAPDMDRPLILKRGESAFIPFQAARVTLKGPGRAVLAGVPR